MVIYLEKLKNVFKEFKRNGVRGVILRILISVNSGPFLEKSIFWNRNSSLLRRTDKVFGRDAKIAYVIPGVNISGGVAVVLHHANGLKKRGYNVRIITFSKETQIDWFENNVPIFSAIRERKKMFEDVDIMIATHWSTVFWVNSCSSPRRLYFVQSDERRFNPENVSKIRLITETYKMDMEYVTEAKWIQKWLKEEFDHDAYYVPNGLDEKIFFQCSPILERTKKPRVLLEGPVNCWFKGMQDAYNSVKDLDCEIWIVSNDGKPKSDWRCDQFFENIPYDKMRQIYSSCDIFLKMSLIEGFFGPPLEAMACGCAVVVGKVTGYNEYIIDGYNALVVDRGDIKNSRESVKRLMIDEKLRYKLIENGKKTAKKWDWEQSIYFLEKVIIGEKPEEFHSTVFLPQYNYIEEVKWLLNKKKEE